MKNIFLLQKKDNMLLLKVVVLATESIITTVDNLIKDTWINEIDKHGLTFNKNFLTGIREIKDTTKIFIVKNEDEQIIASAAIHLNEKIDDCLINHKINNLLTFPNYYFMGLVVDKDYQEIGLGKLLMKYRCDFVKTTNIKCAYYFASKTNLQNVQKNGFTFIETTPTVFQHRPGDFYPLILNL